MNADVDQNANTASFEKHKVLLMNETFYYTLHAMNRENRLEGDVYLKRPWILLSLSIFKT